MTGKTTLIDAIFWGLYGYLPKWGGPKGGQADAVIRRGEKKCYVQVTVDHAGETYKIIRSRPSKLEVFQLVGDVFSPIQGKVSDLDDRIPDLIGMTASQFLISVYVSQDRVSSFFTMSDTDRAKLLSVAARLESLLNALDKAKEQKSEVQAKQQKISGFIAALEGQICSLPDEQRLLEKDAADLLMEVDKQGSTLRSVSEMVKSRIEEIKKAHQVSVESVNQEKDHKIASMNVSYTEKIHLRNTKKAQLRECPQVEAELQQAEAAARQALEAAERENVRRNRIAVDNGLIRAELGGLADSLTQTPEGNCDECGQVLPEEKREAHVQGLLQRAAQLEMRLKEDEPSIDLSPLKQALQDAQKAVILRRSELDSLPKQLQTEISMLDAELQTMKRESELIESNVKFKIAQLGAEVEVETRKAQEELKRAEDDLSRATRDLDRARHALQAVLGRKEGLEVDLQKARTEELELGREMDEILDLIDLFGPKGFRSVCYEGLIERISERAGQLLGLMTDNIYSTRVEQTSENTKGEEKTVLRPVVTKGGLEVPMDDLSGGARRMAMLAYDVAVSEAMGDSSVLFLDEALDGLDPQGKSEAMRLLEEVARTRAVFLVDHTSELKSSCENVLRVTYRDGVSRLDGEAEEEIQDALVRG